jgi:NAD(P)-dependent dehydrogenase (short-subunit alcohol dehydrogenase family)
VLNIERVELKNATGFTAELLLVDMNDFASVSAFATAFQEKYDRLDILVCNAAVVNDTWEQSKDGWEASYVLPLLSFSQFLRRLIR